MKHLSYAEDLVRFIDRSPTSFHASANIVEVLKVKGFIPLLENDRWTLKPGKKYYVEKDGSAIAAFKTGLEAPDKTGFRISGAHTDSPGLKLKPDAFLSKGNTSRAAVEVYGNPIVPTWIDRDLSAAGKVVISIDNKIETRLVNFHRPLGLIPNLAIHLNRDVNKGFEYNKQTHLAVILAEGRASFEEYLSAELNIPKEHIIDFDLFLYGFQKGEIIGGDSGIISCGRLDNLAMCHAVLTSLTEASPWIGTNAAFFFDNEEIGSKTSKGADSVFLNEILERIVLSSGGDREDFFTAKANSFLISADGAHAVHPSYPEKHDEKYAPELNMGPVIKVNTNNKYATSAETSVSFQKLCNKAEVPFQKFIIRSDIPCGSTIGPIVSALSSIKTVDVGNPMWAMHSIRESAGVKDHYYMIKVLTGFYNGE